METEEVDRTIYLESIIMNFNGIFVGARTRFIVAWTEKSYQFIKMRQT